MTVPDTQQADASTTGQQPAASGARKRGRETAGDMVRTLAVVMALVIPMWFLAQPPDSDEQRIRVVDPSGELSAWQAEVPGAPVPAGLPEQWRATSSTLAPESVRVGYVTPEGAYAEFASSAAPLADVLDDLVGATETALPPVQVEGQSWEQYRAGDALSLVRSSGPVVVVVGSVRATAALPELQALAASLEP